MSALPRHYAYSEKAVPVGVVRIADVDGLVGVEAEVLVQIGLTEPDWTNYLYTRSNILYIHDPIK